LFILQSFKVVIQELKALREKVEVLHVQWSTHAIPE
jgi:hypothetical protein